MTVIVTKEKNMMYFQLEGKSSAYAFNISDGTMYGLRGKPITSMPTAIRQGIRNTTNDYNVSYILNYALTNTNWSMSRIVKYMAIMDKMQSIGFKCQLANLVLLDYANLHWKEFCKYYKNHLEEANDCYSLLKNFSIERKKQEFIQKHHLIINEHGGLTEPMLNFMFNNFQNNSIEEVAAVAYWLPRNVWNYHHGGSYEISERILRLFNACKTLNITPTKSDFFRQYSEVITAYELNKEKIDAESLVRNQHNHKNALIYSDDNFTVIIPTTKEEFIVEGNNQNNCVARLYLSKVIEGKTNVVFIRKNNAFDKSYITCEIRNGKIVQYLAKYNHYPDDDELAMAFREAYQNHLTENWEEED